MNQQKSGHADQPVRSMEEHKTILAVRNASIRYSRKLPTVVNDVTFDVRQGEVLILIGRSGCGKSTLLRSLAGLQPLCRGEILLDGRPASGPGPDRMMVFQNFDQLLPWHTALKNIEFALRKSRAIARAGVRERASEALAMVGLTAAADKYPWQLSGGMQQRVAIARALAIRPRVVLMDEPFGALDAMTRGSLQEEVLRLQKGLGITLVFVTHSIEEAVYLGDRIGLMTTKGDFADIFDNPHQGDMGSAASADFAATLRGELEVSTS